jgi:hypothetical protein
MPTNAVLKCAKIQKGIKGGSVLMIRSVLAVLSRIVLAGYQSGQEEVKTVGVDGF